MIHRGAPHLLKARELLEFLVHLKFYSGNYVESGDEVIDYLPPFVIETNEDGTLETLLPSEGGFSHR